MNLEQALRDGFGVEPVSVEPVDGGADLDASRWRVTTASGAYAVKLRSPATTTGLRVSALLAPSLPGVPAPLSSITGEPWWTVEGRQLSVTRWVDGARAIQHDGTRQHWSAYGGLLAGVHAAEVPPGLAADLPSYPSGEAWRDRLLAHQPRHPDLAALWSGGWPQRLADRLDDLAATPVGPPVLSHGDPHLGNLLLVGDGVALVDWDDAMLAPPEWDLMFVRVGVLADRPVTAQQRAWFADGYGAADLDDDLVALFAATRAAEDVVSWSETVDDTTDPAERVWALEIVTGLLGPTGLVEMALVRR